MTKALSKPGGKYFLAAVLAVAAGWLALAQAATAQISKGNQILINRGVQLQGMVQYNDFFNLSTYLGANYTSINWLGTSTPEWMGPPPGVPWSRWVTDITQMPPQNGEDPYLSQLVSLELSDEPDLNDDTVRSNAVNWFNTVQSNYPNVILYVNNYGGQVSDSQLGDFITRAKPDMLCFDTYPFLSDYTTHVPNTWPFTEWFGDLWRYRQFALNTGLPLAVYMQTFNSVEDYDSRIYRNPSPSELRFNTFAALAFNAKVLIGFTYNTGAAALFNILPNGYSGDTYTNALYGEQADVNRRAINFGRTLACLQPIYDLHNQNATGPGPASGDPCACLAPGITTSIMFLQGRYISGGVTNITAPTLSFQTDPQSSANAANPTALSYTWWESGKNDPYLNGWAVSNKGTNNNGLPGEVIISWFKPLDERLDGTNYTNEIYMMVVNALTTTNGTAADCLQEIKLNFLTGTAISAVVMVDPETGLLTTNTLPILAGTGVNTKRQLVLDLNGGDAALFKFSDGAPFVGQITPGVPRLSLQMQGATPALSIQGTVGARYQVQTATSLPATNWTTLTPLMLTTSPFTFNDTLSPSTNTLFYRVVGVR